MSMLNIDPKVRHEVADVNDMYKLGLGLNHAVYDTHSMSQQPECDEPPPQIVYSGLRP